MNDFPEFNHEGLGGMQSFSFVPTHDVDEVPLTIDHNQKNAVVLHAGKQWFIGRALPRTLQLEEKQTRDNTYSYKLSGVLAGSDSDIIPLFDSMARRQFIVDTTDFSGSRRLIGIKNNGMRFSWELDTKPSTSDRKEFFFEFTAELIRPASIYNPV